MNVYRWIMIGLVVCTWGCQGSGGDLDLIERDMRHQEDRIFKLEDYIHEYQAMLDSCRRENDALKRELGLQGASAAPPSSNGVPSRRRGNSTPAGPPKIDFGTPSGASTGPPDSRSYTASSTTSDTLEPAPPGRPVELVINQRLTGGWDADHDGVDEGVMVVIEPRDEAGNVVSSPGEVSLMVVDPEASGPAARLARWDFSSGEAALTWRRTLMGHGLQFQLPWPNDPPNIARARLYARLLMPDGRKLLAEIDFNLERIAGGQGWKSPSGKLARRNDGFIRRDADRSDADQGWNVRAIDDPEEISAEPDSQAPIREESVAAEPPPARRRVSRLKRPEPKTTRHTEANTEAPPWQPYR